MCVGGVGAFKGQGAGKGLEAVLRKSFQSVNSMVIDLYRATSKARLS